MPTVSGGWRSGMRLHLRPLALGAAWTLAASGCGAPSAEGCYAFDWTGPPVRESVLFDSAYLTREPLPELIGDTTRADRFRVVTALENPDTTTLAIGDRAIPRTIRWYFLFPEAAWERLGGDSLRITLTHPSGHHQVITGQATRTGLAGSSRTYDHYRPGDYGQGTEEIFTLLDSATFTARRIGCPSRIRALTI